MMKLGRINVGTRPGRTSSRSKFRGERADGSRWTRPSYAMRRARNRRRNRAAKIARRISRASSAAFA
jgi:hypothetical protein